MIDVVLAAILATYHPPTVCLESSRYLMCSDPAIESLITETCSEWVCNIENPPLQDDGYGKCPAFYHSHEGDPRCFDNDDNPEVEHGPVLPVPHYEL